MNTLTQPQPHNPKCPTFRGSYPETFDMYEYMKDEDGIEFCNITFSELEIQDVNDALHEIETRCYIPLEYCIYSIEEATSSEIEIKVKTSEEVITYIFHRQ